MDTEDRDPITTLDRLATSMEDLAQELREIRPTLRRGLRSTWYALIALALVMTGGGWAAWRYQQGACERGNDTRAAIVDGAEVIVHGAAIDLESPADAQARADRVRDRVAADPRLMPRDC